jgi:hypothetical protein
VVSFRTDSADAASDVRHVLGAPADAELLEAAEFRNLEVSIGYIPVLVEKYFDGAVAFQARNGINADAFHAVLPPSIEAAAAYL